MPLVSRARSLLRNLVSRGRVERELDEELGAALDQLVDEKVAAGLPPEEARRQARLELGGVEPVKEDVRAARAGAWLDGLRQDLRHAARVAARAPAASAAIVLTLAVGIGVNSAMFSFVDAVLFRPLPGVRAPRELVYFRGSLSYPSYLDLREQQEAFADLAAFGGSERVLLGADGGPELVTAELVTASAFAVLGVGAAHGRALRAADELPGAEPALVLADRLWRRRFGADPAVVGRVVQLNGVGARVVGIAPPGFVGTEIGLPRDLWLPLAQRSRLFPPDDGRPRLDQRHFHWLNVVGRLRPGVSLAEAQAVTTAIAGRLAAAHDDSDPEARRRAATLLPVAGGLDPRDREGALVAGAFLMALVGLVLLCACANVAGLTLARALARRRELGVRRALGASRLRLARQLLVESALLAAAGGALGLVLAPFAGDLVAELARGTPVVPPELEIDGRVLGFTLAIATLAALLAGLAPALQASRADALAWLRNDAPGAARRSRPRRALVAAQVAISLLFAVSAALLVRGQTRAVDPGFAVERGHLLAIDPGLARWPAARAQELWRRLVPEIEALPGVERATLMRNVPFGRSFGQTVVAVGDHEFLVGADVVGPGYLGAMGIPLLAGRDLTAADDASAPQAVVINAALARRLEGDPVGQELRPGRDAPPLRVVGIADDSKTMSLSERDRPFLYRPVGQQPRSAMTLLVRARPGAADVVAAVRRRVEELAPGVPLAAAETLAQHVDLALLPARAVAGLLAAFGLLALGLTVVGLYGLVAASVRQRTHEIGVRLALGATRAGILRLVLRDGAGVVAVGIAAGLLLALALTRFLAGLLLDVSPLDPLTFAAAALLLAGVTGLASWLPARRAARVDPTAALRAD